MAFTEKLIQLHRCELLVWSKPGYGSRFLIHLSTDEDYYSQEEIDKNSVLPLKNKSTVTLKKDSQTPNTEDIISHKPSILIVDDEQDMRVYLKKLFENDYVVLEAKDGKNGLVIAQQELPDIIISDIKMPEMDGIEFCRKIKSDAFTAHIPILMLTASTNENIQFESFESGANQYLSKPFNPSLLRVRVKKLLENSKTIKEQIDSNYINDVTNLVKDIPEKENLLNRATEIINEKLSDPEFNINALAAELNLSRTILYRKFKKYTEITPNEFIQVIRLKKSKSLLCRKELTISEVAYLVGYNDAKYFSTSFKKQFNHTPKEYRAISQGNSEVA